MLPQSSSVSQPPRRVGVGIDTSRYGHYSAFLRDNLDPAAAELSFAESAAGYQQLRQHLEHIAQAEGPVHFVIRVDVAGQYGDNLLHFLHSLADVVGSDSAAEARRADAAPLAGATFGISVGDPVRNKNYRVALYGDKKADPIEARACARFAVSERPGSDKALSSEFRNLRQVAGRLQAVVRHRTRLINQLHHLLHLAFPELALLVGKGNLAAGWVLEMLHRYPSAGRIAQATDQDLAAIPYLPEQHIAKLLQHAQSSVASLAGPAIEELIRDQVRQLRDTGARQKNLEKLLVAAYHALPERNHLDTIPGIGDSTAAVLTAFIVDVGRFDTPGKLVKYFGVLPFEIASGVDRDGNPRGPKRYVMSKRGNDLVRRYLWLAAMSAVQHNPAVRALYARVIVKHPQHHGIAIGHAMRKLLHLAYAVWKTSKPFDAEHYPWQAPAHVEKPEVGSQKPEVRGQKSEAKGQKAKKKSAIPMSQEDQAAGLTRTAEPAPKEVTAARDKTHVDFGHLKNQLKMEQVLDQLGLLGRLRGNGVQRRGPCPLHRGDARGRTFSVHLEDNVFHCFDPACAKHGDVIDLWASVNGMSLRDAALDLVHTFHLEPAPKKGTEKRHG